MTKLKSVLVRLLVVTALVLTAVAPAHAWISGMIVWTGGW